MRVACGMIYTMSPGNWKVRRKRQRKFVVVFSKEEEENLRINTNTNASRKRRGVRTVGEGGCGGKKIRWMGGGDGRRGGGGGIELVRLDARSSRRDGRETPQVVKAELFCVCVCAPSL